jgi:mono/diheme cytochrome c family protein
MILLCGAMVSLAADGRWLKHVPEADRNRVNPFADQPETIAAEGRVFHCAKCHGDDATGRAKRPSLRNDRVQRATDGEIFWLLRNGRRVCHLGGVARADALADYRLHQEPVPATPSAADIKPN